MLLNVWSFRLRLHEPFVGLHFKSWNGKRSHHLASRHHRVLTTFHFKSRHYHSRTSSETSLLTRQDDHPFSLRCSDSRNQQDAIPNRISALLLFGVCVKTRLAQTAIISSPDDVCSRRKGASRSLAGRTRRPLSHLDGAIGKPWVYSEKSDNKFRALRSGVCIMLANVVLSGHRWVIDFLVRNSGVRWF